MRGGRNRGLVLDGPGGLSLYLVRVKMCFIPLSISFSKLAPSNLQLINLQGFHAGGGAGGKKG